MFFKTTTILGLLKHLHFILQKSLFYKLRPQRLWIIYIQISLYFEIKYVSSFCIQCSFIIDLKKFQFREVYILSTAIISVNIKSISIYRRDPPNFYDALIKREISLWTKMISQLTTNPFCIKLISFKVILYKTNSYPRKKK